MSKQTRHRFEFPGCNLYKVLLKYCLSIIIGIANNIISIANKADLSITNKADLSITNAIFAISRPFSVLITGNLGTGSSQTVIKPAN